MKIAVTSRCACKCKTRNIYFSDGKGSYKDHIFEGGEIEDGAMNGSTHEGRRNKELPEASDTHASHSTVQSRKCPIPGIGADIKPDRRPPGHAHTLRTETTIGIKQHRYAVSTVPIAATYSSG
jgi:hypothetical protein